jgi:hypothetical protein
VQENLFVETTARIKLQLFNQSGKLLNYLEMDAGKHSVNTTALSPGVYTLRIVGDTGAKTMKLIKLE